MYRMFTLLLCSLCTLTVFSQKNFVPAHLTTLDGRTYVGEIDFREWTINPDHIRFRPSADGKIQELSVREVAGFQIDEQQEKYIRAEISIIDESIEFDQLPFFRNVLSIDHRIPRVEATVFLRVLAEGTLNLYQFIDQNHRLHYYLQKGTGPIEELTYRVVKLFEAEPVLQAGMRRTDNAHIVILETYKMELAKAMTNGCPKLQSAIGQLPYSNLIKNLVVSYNECLDNSTYVMPRQKSYHAFFVQAGILNAGFSANDQNHPETIKLSKDLSAYLGLGYEFAVPRTRDKFILGLELGFFSSRSIASNEFFIVEGARRSIRYELEQNVSQFSLYGKFIPFKVKYAPYIKAGLGIFHYRKNSFTVQDNRPNNYVFSRHDLKKAEMTSLLGIGIQSRRFFTEFRYGSGTDINPTTGYDLQIDRWSLVLGVKFM
ncbi:hypothetical protein [Flavilitoribacter nigricans]|uniref:Outer membrane protein beta-barrel domain-containing protein n=1 Tax=Flavilitoribacter nigricans (strain ATCC 23147 / DSM 23189 / NBRC 102662 / NCIMB 1420 / SS-2) TaxID=1122177 RepID=A0A2D0N819_FLAN2|nr:hypothetical protein [Flavilitoribacter nigricans]PHN04664.1 hypothetical protein CRP01_19285 [Flavilitoribacter nigricans DSM 23189 = NBRC 102662]